MTKEQKQAILHAQKIIGGVHEMLKCMGIECRTCSMRSNCHEYAVAYNPQPCVLWKEGE